MTELLCPAGNLKKLYIAFAYGADCVYLSGLNFGLRAGSGNFTEHEIAKGISYAHSLGKKVYITLNAFLWDQDFSDLKKFIEFLDRLGADGTIVSDAGTAEAVLKNSGIPVHVSTQASVTSTRHALFWKDLGAKRIVLGREVSIADAVKIKEKTGLEVEIFIHGAMCMSFSGHCVISNFTAGRDSNRGGCIQSCRHVYEISGDGKPVSDRSLLSSKELNGLRHLKTAMDAGIDSLKIEGRMKSPLYLATVTHVYSEAMKKIRDNADLNDLTGLESELLKIPHRGYTDGNLINPAGPDSVYLNQDEGRNYNMAGMILDKTGPDSFFYASSNVDDVSKLEFVGFPEARPFRGTVTDSSGSITEKLRQNKLYRFTGLDIPVNTVARI